MDLYISTHCDGDKSDLNLAIAQVVASVPGCDADTLTNKLKRVVCDELYKQTLTKRKSSEFLDSEWPVLRTSCDEFANNQPSAQTMTARRLSVTAVYKAAGFQGSVVYLYTWVAEQGRIVKALRDKYTNETTFQSHWINFLQFVKIVAPDMVQSYAQAFKATQNDANRKERYVMPVETLNRIRKSNTLLVDQATVILNSQTEDKLLTSKQLQPVMAALVVEAFYGAQPMRRGDWRTVKLPSACIDVSKDNFLSVDEGKVTLTMTYAAKVGQLAKQVSVDFSLESPRFNELLLLCCQTIHPYTGYLFITPTGLQYCPTNFSNLLKQTLLQKLQIELPSYGVTMTRHAVVNEEREENAKKRRTRGLVQTEMNHAKQRLHSSSTANQVYGVR